MTKDALDEAIIEAKRFLAAAALVKWGKPTPPFHPGQPAYSPQSYGPLPAAAKRASMDLTRALAKVRKP